MSELLKTRQFRLGLKHGLNGLFSLLDILGSQSAARRSDLSDLVGLGVVRLSSCEVDSVGCHRFIIYKSMPKSN